MSGHSKWASIKHKKAATDAKRGKVFTRIIKELTVAAKLGGGLPENNPRLRTAMDAAKGANMPKDNIERAIKKGTGELPGVIYEEITYEGYASGGVAVLVEVTTDNKNRSASEIRHTFAKHGGNLGESGCVAWMFESQGLILIPVDTSDEDTVMEAALDAGAMDIEGDEHYFTVTTAPEDLHIVKEALEAKSFTVEEAKLNKSPKNTVELDENGASKVFKLLDKLEENDDVNNVYANFDVSDEIMEKLSQ